MHSADCLTYSPCTEDACGIYGMVNAHTMYCAPDTKIDAANEFGACNSVNKYCLLFPLLSIYSAYRLVYSTLFQKTLI